MRYRTLSDTLAKAVTIGMTLLLSGIFIGQLLFMNGESTTGVFLLAIFLSLYVSALLFRPVSYRLMEDRIVIHRPASNVQLERKQIIIVRQVDPEEMKWTIRTLGAGPFFWYWGQFTNLKLGNMTWYATRRNKAVMVEMRNRRRIIITPDEPEQFVAAYHQPE